MYNKTVLDMIFEAKDDAVAVACKRFWELIATLVFMAMIPWGRKFWLKAIHFGGFLESIAYVAFPEKCISPFIVEAEGKLDSVHLELVREVGLLFLMFCVSYWLLSNSTDSTIVTSFLWSQAILGTCLLLCQGYLITHPGKAGVKIDTKSMTTGFYCTMLYTLGTYYYAMRSNDWGGYGEISSHANIHLRLDFVLLMVMGILLYAMPQWVLRLQTNIQTIDSTHAYLARGCGAVIIAMSMMAGRAANFLRRQDKDAIVLTHLMFYVIVAVGGWYCRLKDASLLTWKSVGLYGLHDMVIIFNAMGALNLDHMVFERILWTRLRQVPRDVKVTYRDIKNRL